MVCPFAVHQTHVLPANGSAKRGGCVPFGGRMSLSLPLHVPSALLSQHQLLAELSPLGTPELPGGACSACGGKVAERLQLLALT